jgi:hypothetical protein
MYTHLPPFFLPRESVWLKTLLMHEMQHKRPGCDWFVAMDSDAYFWMSNHTVSLSQWLSTASLHASPGFHEFETEKRNRRGFYDWDDQTAFFIVGLNGVFSTAECFPAYDDRNNYFICAGVYFIKNGARSKQFLHDWVSGPVDTRRQKGRLCKTMLSDSALSSGSLMLSSILGTRAGSIFIPIESLVRRIVL